MNELGKKHRDEIIMNLIDLDQELKFHLKYNRKSLKDISKEVK